MAAGYGDPGSEPASTSASALQQTILECAGETATAA
jgi:hypothetical protein